MKCLVVLVCVVHVMNVCVQGKRVSLEKHQQFILDQHNEYRREERASNMCLMKWNITLEAAAARWAERCEFKHERTSGHGENLAFDSRSFETEKLLDGLMTGWHNEKRTWTYGSNSCGFSCHFTQLVWHSTNQVGCAAVRCPSLKGMMGGVKNAFYLVCFYNPKGNWIGEVPYIPGQACSKCEEGSTCSKDLCDNSGVSGNKEPSSSALSVSQPKPNNHFSVIRQSSRFETFSHGTGADRKTVSRGTSSFHRSGKLPQGLFNSLRKGKFIPQSDQAVGKPLSLQKQGVTLRDSVDPKWRRFKCRDRLPSCWKWAGRCGSNRAMKVMCPKSCDACQDQYNLVEHRHHKSVVTSRRDDVTEDESVQSQRTDSSHEVVKETENRQNLVSGSTALRGPNRFQKVNGKQNQPKSRPQKNTKAAPKQLGQKNNKNRKSPQHGGKNRWQFKTWKTPQQIRVKGPHRASKLFQRRPLFPSRQPPFPLRRPQQPTRQPQRPSRQPQRPSRQPKFLQRRPAFPKRHQQPRRQHQSRPNFNFHQRRPNHQQRRPNQLQRRPNHPQRRPQPQRRRWSSRERVNQQRPQLKHKQARRGPRQHHNQVNSNGFCQDNGNFASRCGYWASNGFCEENYMMRDLYCKKSCGNC